MKNRLRARRTLTRLGVDEPDSVRSVASTRSLNQVEAERIRDRIVELIAEKGSEKLVGEHTGVSQQTIGKIKNRLITAGYFTATKVADADRVPVEALLDGVPPALYKAISSRRWPDHVTAAVSKMALTMSRSRTRTAEEWVEVLRRTEELLSELAKSGPR